MGENIVEDIHKNNTPSGASLAAGSVSQSLNSSEGRNSELGRKTSLTLRSEPTCREQRGMDQSVPFVFVLNIKGEPIMPCSPCMAKHLLKKGSVKIVGRTPFIIQFIIPVGNNKQEIVLGIDPGYEHVGISAISGNKELYSADVKLRTDMVRLIAEKRMYRRTRRNRKTSYRKSRFLNRKTKELTPSIQHKLDSHVRIVEKIMQFLPVSRIIFEENNFDIQKIKNPEISGDEYQQGEQLGFENVKAYVLHRDGHKCVHCGSIKKVRVHHIVSKMIGGSRPENLASLCEKCHIKYHIGGIRISFKCAGGFKEATCMNIIRKRIIEKLKNICSVEITFGYITKFMRKQLNIEKTHMNDAFVIAGGSSQIRTSSFKIKQRRRNNRCLEIHRNGFVRSIRRQRYKFQPMCLVRYLNKIYKVVTSASYGKCIYLKGIKNSINPNKLELIKFNEGFNYI